MGTMTKARAAMPGQDGATKESIDYKGLQKFVSCESDSYCSREEEHEHFMKLYPSIFSKRTIRRVAISEDGRLEKLAALHRNVESPPLRMSHNIADHISQMRNGRTSPSALFLKGQRIRTLRAILKKPPYERTRIDNEQMFQQLQWLPCFSSVSKKVLKALCPYVISEKWTQEEIGFTVFATNALYLVLKGSVLKIRDSKLKQRSLEDIFKEDLSKLPFCETITVGDHFGSCNHNREDGGKSPSVELTKFVTAEPCEFLKVLADSYKRVIKAIEEEELEGKFGTLQKSSLFASLPMLSLKNICKKLIFVEKAAGEVLATEGGSSDFLSVIKKGRCLVIKRFGNPQQSQDASTSKNRIIVGELGPGDVIAYESVFLDAPLDTTVKCRTLVSLVCLPRTSLADFDDVTLKFIQHRYEDLQKTASQESLERSYVESRIQLDWKRVKRRVISDVIYYNGILPGQSKWALNPSRKYGSTSDLR